MCNFCRYAPLLGAAALDWVVYDFFVMYMHMYIEVCVYIYSFLLFCSLPALALPYILLFLSFPFPVLLRFCEGDSL